MRSALVAGLCAWAWVGCIDVGQESVAFPLHVAGTETSVLAGRHGYEVELFQADLAFGPLYLCASQLAGDLCETARAQWRENIVVDALNAAPQAAGDMEGISGEVRSLMYDAGLSVPLSASEPIAGDAAKALGDASVVLAGVARRDDVEIPFEAAIALYPTTPGRQLVSGQLEAHHLGPETTGLVLTFDPEPWIQTVDFDSFLDAAGEFSDPEPVRFEPNTQPYRALIHGLVTNARPRVVWEDQP